MIKNEEERDWLVKKIERATEDKKIELIIGELYEGHNWREMSLEEKKEVLKRLWKYWKAKLVAFLF